MCANGIAGHAKYKMHAKEVIKNERCCFSLTSNNNNT